ncbi:MAG TPA: hypothetical protein VFG23_01885 [Polyangia bacterium]|nr:hypothetical protein [Polyangia bacterium]
MWRKLPPSVQEVVSAICDGAAGILQQNLFLGRGDLAREKARIFGSVRMGTNVVVVAAVNTRTDLIVLHALSAADGSQMTWKGVAA